MPERKIAKSSAWTLETIERYLTETVVPCRLACVTSEGVPHVSALWFLYSEDALYFSVQENAWVYRWLQANPLCGFDVSVNDPPYLGVRGRGEAAAIRAREHTVLPQLLDRYLGSRDSKLARWLLSRVDTEITIRVEPRWLSAWDYGGRMNAG